MEQRDAPSPASAPCPTLGSHTSPAFNALPCRSPSKRKTPTPKPASSRQTPSRPQGAPVKQPHPSAAEPAAQSRGDGHGMESIEGFEARQEGLQCARFVPVTQGMRRKAARKGFDMTAGQSCSLLATAKQGNKTVGSMTRPVTFDVDRLRRSEVCSLPCFTLKLVGRREYQTKVSGLLSHLLECTCLFSLVKAY